MKFIVNSVLKLIIGGLFIVGWSYSNGILSFICFFGGCMLIDVYAGENK